MAEIVIDKDYKAFQKNCTENKIQKLLSVQDARAYSKKLIRKGQQKSNG